MPVTAQALQRQLDALATPRAIIEQAGGLANVTDLARQWKISRQRVSVLSKQEGFPEPVGEVNGRPVWLGQEAREWRDNQLKGRKT